MFSSQDFTKYLGEASNIKVMIPYGDTLSDLKHLVCDEAGNVLMQKATSQKETKKNQLFKILGENVSCG